MRRALGLSLALLMGLSIAGFRIFGSILKDKEAVEYTLLEEYGDRSAAEGLMISLSEHFDYRLLWKSQICPADQHPKGETRLSLSYRAIHDDPRDIEYGVSIYKDLSVRNYDEVGRNRFGLHKAIDEMYQAAGPGGRSVKTVALKDYYDYYPMSIFIRLPGLNYYSDSAELEYRKDEEITNEPEYCAIKALQDFLRIPVPENEYVFLELERSYSEGFYSVGTTSAYSEIMYSYYQHAGSGTEDSQWAAYDQRSMEYLQSLPEDTDDFDEAYLTSFSDAADGCCYFTFDPHTVQGRLLDTSLIPGGYGIYLLPYGYVDQDDYYRYDHYSGYDVFENGLRMFCPLNENIRVLDLHLSPDGRHILLHYASEGRYMIDVIDVQSAELVQTLDLREYSPGEMWSTVIRGDDFQLIRFDGSGFCVLAKDAGGLYSIVIDYKYEDTAPERQIYLMENDLCQFDLRDGRLAVCAPCSMGYAYYELSRGHVCGFDAAIYSADGLEYYCSYDSSLDEASHSEDWGWTEGNTVRPFGSRPVVPIWK